MLLVTIQIPDIWILEMSEYQAVARESHVVINVLMILRKHNNLVYDDSWTNS